MLYPCKKGNCDLIIQTSLFGRKYVECQACSKSAGIVDTEAKAMAEWNRWVEIGGFIEVE